jgi:hypothetical protein
MNNMTIEFVNKIYGLKLPTTSVDPWMLGLRKT